MTTPITSFFFFFLLIATIIVSLDSPGAIASLACRGSHSPRHMTVEYYVHDNLLQKDATNTAFIIAGPGGNVTALMQGSLIAINDLMTEGPAAESKRLGRAQGVYSVAQFFPDAPHIHQQFTAVFSAGGRYGASSICYQGDDGDLLLPVREIAVVGGTGQFRGATGYSFVRTVRQTGEWSYVLQFETHLTFGCQSIDRR